MEKPTVLVTGGAGYIGSHTVLALKEAGYTVLVLDNLIYGHRELVEQVLQVKLICGDICDRPLLDQIFTQYNIQAVLHFAAYAYVGESVENPAKYYRNNVAGTLTLLEAMVQAESLASFFPLPAQPTDIPNKFLSPKIIPKHPSIPME